jgi:hypothetical protein
VLRTAGIVITYRNGKYIHYTIDYAKVAIAVKAIGNFLAKPSES